MALLSRGAEAIVDIVQRGVRKHRVPKSYRHPQLDARLRGQRTKAEVRLLGAAMAAGVRVPRVHEETSDTIILEKIAGTQLRDVLERTPLLAKKLGRMVARLHAQNIIHGDLTTSNVLVDGKDLVLIDFGLAFRSERVEDKAVDLHVFVQSLASRHHRVEAAARRAFLAGYGPGQVRDRLAAVEGRGRNKRS